MKTITRTPRQQFYNFDAQSYQQGGRTAYSITMTLGLLDSILPYDVDEKRITDANRRFNRTHARNIADYIRETENWVLGAILLGINPKYVRFQPYEVEGDMTDTLGEITIPYDRGRSNIKILDGQHRRMAILDVLKSLRDQIDLMENQISVNGADARKLDRLQSKFDKLYEMAIQVIIYEEADPQSLRQMFADLAKTRNMDDITKARFDERDPFNRAAGDLASRITGLLPGRVEMERSTPPRRSNMLLSLNQLAKILKVLRYGYGGRASRDRIHEAQLNYDSIIEMGIDFADDFLPKAREEYESLLSLDLEEGYIANNRSKRIAYATTVIQLLAGCVYEWQKIKPDDEKSDRLAIYLRESNWDISSEDCLFIKAGVLLEGDTSLLSRSQNMKGAIQFIIREAQVQN